MAGRIRRLLPPAAMVLGLFLFGLSLAQLSFEVSPETAVPIHAGSLTAANGTAILLYPIDYFGYGNAHLDVNYTFPQEAGRASFVDCEDAAALARGQPARDPLLTFVGQRQGSFVVSHQTLPSGDRYLTYDEVRRTPCEPAVALEWAAGTDLAANKPTVSVLYYEEGFEGEDLLFLSILMGGSALLTLLGGLAWVRTGYAASAPPAQASTVETLRASLDQVVVQLERTRKNLLFAGILGVFLWYPFLVPWSWQQAARVSDGPFFPWAVAGLTLLFLVSLTVLWAREFLRLDRNISAWRGRLDELRSREDHLMQTLEQDGG